MVSTLVQISIIKLFASFVINAMNSYILGTNFKLDFILALIQPLFQSGMLQNVFAIVKINEYGIVVIFSSEENFGEGFLVAFTT